MYLKLNLTQVLKSVSTNLHDGLKKGFLLMLKGMIKKLQERSPIKYRLVQVAACLCPVNMANIDSEKLQKMFDTIVEIMHQHKRISCKEGDRAKEQYDNCLSNVVVCNQNPF